MKICFVYILKFGFDTNVKKPIQKLYSILCTQFNFKPILYEAIVKCKWDIKRK